VELVQRINTRKKQVIIAQCEKCGREIEIPYANTINPHKSSIDLKGVIKCECGEYHNLIVETKSNRPPSYHSSQEDDIVKCPCCDSTQLHAGDKGFGLVKAAAGGLLAGPVGLLGGLIGSKKVMITCLKCGHKWQAGKR